MPMVISCIITSYNNSAFIEQAVLSVISQTYDVDEIIISDDASTDASQDIIQRLALKNSRIRAILRKKNIGVSANRDLAIREARGDFISTLDGDDFYYPSKIEKEWMVLKSNMDAIAYSDKQVVDLEGNPVGVAENKGGFSELARKEKFMHLLYRSPLVPLHMLLSKKIYLCAGGYRHDLRVCGEQQDFKIRLIKQTNDWRYAGNVGYAVRRSRVGEYKSLSSTASSFEHARFHVRNFIDYRKYLLKEIGSVRYLSALLFIFCRHVYGFLLKMCRKQ